MANWVRSKKCPHFRNRLRDEREARKLSQVELASLMNVSQQTISVMESGGIISSSTAMAAACRALQLPIQEIFQVDLE